MTNEPPKIYSKRKGSPPPPDNAVYVGRYSAGDWGNRWHIRNEANRDQVCDRFDAYAVERHADDPEWLAPLRGKSLICWCTPKRCHAETLLRLANENEETK